MNLPVQRESCVLIVESSEEMLFTQFLDLSLSYTLRNHKITVEQLSWLIRLMIVLAKTHSQLTALGDLMKRCLSWIINNVYGPEWDPSSFRGDFTVMQIILACALIPFCSIQSAESGFSKLSKPGMCLSQQHRWGLACGHIPSVQWHQKVLARAANWMTNTVASHSSRNSLRICHDLFSLEALWLRWTKSAFSTCALKHPEDARTPALPTSSLLPISRAMQHCNATLHWPCLAGFWSQACRAAPLHSPTSKHDEETLFVVLHTIMAS